MIVETHIHLNHEQYNEDLNEVIKRAKDAGVKKMIDIGCEPHTLDKSLAIAKENENIYCSLGLHPVDVKDESEHLFDKIKQMAQTNKEVVAIGEIGLDYHWYPEQKEQQKQVFKRQMKMAEELELPVIIHSRDAYEDCLEIVKQFPNVTGVIHSFSSDFQMAKQFTQLGYMIGIGGPVTFKNGHNQRDVVNNIDLDKLLIETDGPYMTPTPNRGKRNEPAYLQYIVEKIAAERNITEKQLKQQLYTNSIKLFKGIK